MLQLDGTDNKGKLGANAILAVSLAVAKVFQKIIISVLKFEKAGAAEKGLPLYKYIAELAGNKQIILPVPAFNVINGGSHAGNKLAMQEFMVIIFHNRITIQSSTNSNSRIIEFVLIFFQILPIGAPSFKEAMRYGAEVYHNLKSIIKDKYGQDATNVGDEGGFAPNIQNNKEGLELLKAAIAKGKKNFPKIFPNKFTLKKNPPPNNFPTPETFFFLPPKFSSLTNSPAGYTDKVKIGMDVAASEFFTSDGKYDLDFKTKNNDKSEVKSGTELTQLYKEFVNEFPVISIEDPFDQDDWNTYNHLTSEIGANVQIVGNSRF
jgi:enolase